MDNSLRRLRVHGPSLHGRFFPHHGHDKADMSNVCVEGQSTTITRRTSETSSAEWWCHYPEDITLRLFSNVWIGKNLWCVQSLVPRTLHEAGLRAERGQRE